jgi:hypothetical protein
VNEQEISELEKKGEMRLVGFIIAERSINEEASDQ